MKTVVKTIETVIKQVSYLHGYQGSQTPYYLAKESLDEMNVNWSDKNLKVLDSACAHGIFLIAALVKMIESGDTIKNAVRNRLYGCENARNKYLVAFAALKKISGVTPNIFNENGLEKVWDMKFDVIVGNPPYQDSNNKAKNNKLWHKFVMKTDYLKHNGWMCFVNPVSMFSNIGISEKIMKKYTKDMSIKYVRTHDTMKQNPFPNVGVATCHWVAVKTPYNGKTMYNGNIVDLRDKNSILSEKDIMVNDILDKVESFKMKLPLLCEDVDITDSGKYEYYISGKKKGRSNHASVYDGDLKYVVSFSASYTNQFVTTLPVTKFNRFILIKNENEVKQIQSFLQSKLIKFFALKYRKTAGFTPAVKNNQIPDLRGDEIWTDEKLYKKFKLTKEEIDLVENIIK